MSSIPFAGRPLLLALAVLVAAGCDSGADSTYPDAGAFPFIEVADLNGATPDTYNVAAFVSDVMACPVGDNCLSEGTIELAASNTVLPPDDSPRVLVDSPGQFVRGDRYLLSVLVQSVPARRVDDDDPTSTRLTLVGYDRIDD